MTVFCLRKILSIIAMQKSAFTRLIHLDKRLELTLALMKPDATANPCVVQSIRDIILNNGFYVVRTKQCKLTLEEAKEFYSSHREQFFYNRLTTFMSSGPIFAHLLAQHNSIAKWRKLMGPTKTYRAQHEDPQSIRGQFGLTDTRNVVHGADCCEAVIRESKFFFPKFSHSQWEEEEEQLFRSNNVTFDKILFEHRIENTKSESLNVNI